MVYFFNTSILFNLRYDLADYLAYGVCLITVALFVCHPFYDFSSVFWLDDEFVFDDEVCFGLFSSRWKSGASLPSSLWWVGESLRVFPARVFPGDSLLWVHCDFWLSVFACCCFFGICTFLWSWNVENAQGYIFYLNFCCTSFFFVHVNDLFE